MKWYANEVVTLHIFGAESGSSYALMRCVRVLGWVLTYLCHIGVPSPPPRSNSYDDSNDDDDDAGNVPITLGSTHTQSARCEP